MRVHVAFQGGSYAPPETEDWEVFPSLAAAAEEFERRAFSRRYPLFHEVQGLAIPAPAEGSDFHACPYCTEPTHVGRFTNRTPYSQRFVWERVQ